MELCSENEMKARFIIGKILFLNSLCPNIFHSSSHSMLDNPKERERGGGARNVGHWVNFNSTCHKPSFGSGFFYLC